MGVLKLKLPSGRVVEVLEPRALLGRDPNVEVVVDDRSVSRKHALVERRGEAWFVIDQNSSNGTFVGGQRVTQAALRDGQELRLGTVVLQIEIEAPEVEATVLMAPPSNDMATVLSRPPAPPRVAAPPVRPAAPASPPAPPPSEPRGPAGAIDRAAAAERLGLALGASSEQVRRRYDELAAKAQEHLAAAANPQVKAHCERQLEELRSARDVLCAIPAPAVPKSASYDPADLPSAQPVVVDQALESMILRVSPLVAAGDVAPPTRVDVGMHPLTKVFGSLAIVLFSVGLFLVIGRGKTAGEIADKKAAADYRSAIEAAETYRGTESLVREGLLVNRRLVVCNTASEPMLIAWLGASWIEPSKADAQGPSAKRTYKVRKFHSGYCGGAFNVSIPPGGKRTFTFAAADDRCKWDGAALHFGLSAVPARQAQSEDVQALWYAGVPGGEATCVKIGTAQ